MIRFQVLISLLLIIVPAINGMEVTASSSVRRDCPRNWTKYERTKSCLMVNEQRLKWADAERHCQKFGAHLASVADVFENNFVFDFAKQVNLSVPTVWLGKLTRPDKNTPYEWHDGSQKVFRQTNFSGSTICLTMWLDMERAEVSWNEWDCNYVGYSSVCKKSFRRNPQQVTAPTHPEGKSPDYPAPK
uniref:C-type lectin domain-containing protein n=1 Tax=Panagrolaimus sp. JU765 TaxID=591449 RepID=A0AC34QVK9_9BILA